MYGGLKFPFLFRLMESPLVWGIMYFNFKHSLKAPRNANQILVLFGNEIFISGSLRMCKGTMVASVPVTRACICGPVTAEHLD